MNSAPLIKERIKLFLKEASNKYSNNADHCAGNAWASTLSRETHESNVGRVCGSLAQHSDTSCEYSAGPTPSSGGRSPRSTASRTSQDVRMCSKGSRRVQLSHRTMAKLHGVRLGEGELVCCANVEEGEKGGEEKKKERKGNVDTCTRRQATHSAHRAGPRGRSTAASPRRLSAAARRGSPLHRGPPTPACQWLQWRWSQGGRTPWCIWRRISERR